MNKTIFGITTLAGLALSAGFCLNVAAAVDTGDPLLAFIASAWGVGLLWLRTMK